jgi:hypothetical protein
MLGRRPMSNSPTEPMPLASRVLWGTSLAFAVLALVTFFVLASQRLVYPFELEWMEGAMVDHASRIANGLPLYCAPTPEHVPFLYAPLLFWIAGLAMKLGVPGLFALRLIAGAASVGTAMLIGHWVRKETGRFVPGLAASGLFLAGYGWLFWWYDLARNDSLFLLTTLSCAYTLRHGGPRRWLLAGVLAAIAVLAKQSAVMWLPAIGVGALLHDWKTALRFGVTGIAAIALSLGVLHLTSDGWSTFYLFEMPRHHGIEGSRKLGFWTEDLQPMLPLVALAGLGFVLRCRGGEIRNALFLAAVGSGGLVTSWFSRMHVGGFDNVMMYGFAAACVLGPVAVIGTGRVTRIVVPGLVLAQFLILGAIAWHRNPAVTALPSAAHRQAHEELFAYVQSQPRDVLILGHGGISARAGKATGAHGQAIFDLLQVLPKQPDGALDLLSLADPVRLAQLPGKANEALVSICDGLMKALIQQRYSAIVLDEQMGVFEIMFRLGLVGPDGQQGTPDDLYRRRPGQLLTNGPALNPLVGFEAHSPYAWEATK